MFFVLVALLSCDSDEPVPLIRKYTLEKDSDLLFQKYQGDNLFPLSKEQFAGLHVNADGSLLVVHTDYSAGRFTVSHLSSSFDFIGSKDFNETVGYVSRADNGELVVQSTQGSNWLIRTLDQSITATSTHTIPIPNYFVRFTVNETDYYMVEYNSGSATMTKYNGKGEQQWKKLLSEFAINFNVRQVFAENSDAFFLASENPANDSLTIARVNNQNGALIWSSRYLKTELTESGVVNYLLPSSNGDLFLNGTDVADPGIVHLSRINNKGSVIQKRKVTLPDGTDSQAGPMLEETDGGVLVGLATDWTKEVASFRLLKTDSKLNGGWVGSFTQIASGTITGIRKLLTGEVIVLTSNGHLYRLKPEQ